MQFEDLLKQLLVLDSTALSANVDLLVTVADKNTLEELIGTRGPGAQSFVNLFHAVCLRVIYISCYIDVSI
jgi:hypothetical protein